MKPRAAVACLAVASTLTLTGVVVAHDASAATVCHVIPAAAHRGGTEHYVENTADSFRDASNVGAGIWETDIRFTSDDVPVVMHDPDVDRTTDGTGLVADHTAAEIAAMRTSDDQPVPTLREVINDARVDGPRFLVELKVEPTPAQWATFNAAIASRPVAARIVVASFDQDTLTAAKTQAPTLTRALIQDVGDVDPAAVTPYASILMKHHNAVTWSRLAKWTGAGLTVMAWTVDDTAEWQRMSGYPNLSGVITNRPQAYIAWQKSQVC